MCKQIRDVMSFHYVKAVKKLFMLLYFILNKNIMHLCNISIEKSRKGYLQVNKRCYVIMLRQSKKCLVKTFLKNLNRGNNKDITYYHPEMVFCYQNCSDLL